MIATNFVFFNDLISPQVKFDWRVCLLTTIWFDLQAVIKFMEERVQQLIVTAVLEHEAIAGLSSHKQPASQNNRLSR